MSESRMMAGHRRARSAGPSRLAKLARSRCGPGCRAAAWRGRADRTLRYEYEMLERQLHDHADARARGRRPAKVPDEVCVVVDQPTEESSSGRAACSGPPTRAETSGRWAAADPRTAGPVGPGQGRRWRTRDGWTGGQPRPVTSATGLASSSRPGPPRPAAFCWTMSANRLAGGTFVARRCPTSD